MFLLLMLFTVIITSCNNQQKTYKDIEKKGNIIVELQLQQVSISTEFCVPLLSFHRVQMLKLRSHTFLATMVWMTLNSTVEITEDQPNDQEKAIYSELLYQGSQSPSLACWQRLKSRQRNRVTSQWRRGKASGNSNRRLLAQ